MSFSGNVKEELSRRIPQARHCQIAELAALIGMCGSITISCADRYAIKIHTEKLSVARKCFTLLKKTFNIEVDVSIRRNSVRGHISYLVAISKHEDALRIL